MANASSNKDLSNETAETLLTSIRDAAKDENVASTLLTLSQAYAAVADVAPKRDSSGRGGGFA
ncbi:hypothetical protein GCM10011492_06710 [Flexivirga endophytica]|uniref:Uncharacterized protein n=1 Tax=Flexivirga endophytica TaxID=1849103 RepID=A0A916SY34_9MICO|nr:hypothetical protein [Flexivirga endophytica]GGB19526.1 hypothetical protein GCM10011492_06710 [Flexivirga endophytica]GHB36170.1 hypothetical protein GCM10008112_00900 [Flexivirga endophytica]